VDPTVLEARFLAVGLGSQLHLNRDTASEPNRRALSAVQPCFWGKRRVETSEKGGKGTRRDAGGGEERRGRWGQGRRGARGGGREECWTVETSEEFGADVARGGVPVMLKQYGTRLGPPPILRHPCRPPGVGAGGAGGKRESVGARPHWGPTVAAAATRWDSNTLNHYGPSEKPTGALSASPSPQPHPPAPHGPFSNPLRPSSPSPSPSCGEARPHAPGRKARTGPAAACWEEVGEGWVFVRWGGQCRHSSFRGNAGSPPFLDGPRSPTFVPPASPAPPPPLPLPAQWVPAHCAPPSSPPAKSTDPPPPPPCLGRPGPTHCSARWAITAQVADRPPHRSYPTPPLPRPSLSRTRASTRYYPPDPLSPPPHSALFLQPASSPPLPTARTPSLRHNTVTAPLRPPPLPPPLRVGHLQ